MTRGSAPARREGAARRRPRLRARAPGVPGRHQRTSQRGDVPAAAHARRRSAHLRQGAELRSGADAEGVIYATPTYDITPWCSPPCRRTAPRPRKPAASRRAGAGQADEVSAAGRFLKGGGAGLAAMAVSLGELAVRFGCELRGDPDTQVERVATLGNAERGALSFLANPRYRAQLARHARDRRGARAPRRRMSVRRRCWWRRIPTPPTRASRRCCIPAPAAPPGVHPTAPGGDRAPASMPSAHIGSRSPSSARRWRSGAQASSARTACSMPA